MSKPVQQRHIVFDLEWPTAYSECGWHPLICMSYADLQGGDVALVAREDACKLLRDWLADPYTVLWGWNLGGDLATIAGTCDGRLDGPTMQVILGAYDDNRIRCGMQREIALDIALDEVRGGYGLASTAALHGIEVTVEKKAPPEVQEWIDKGIDSRQWPAEIRAACPVRFRYGELEGLPVSEYPPEFDQYAREDIVLTRQIIVNQGSRRGRVVGVEPVDIPDERTQAIAAFYFALAEAQGMRSDVERARAMMSEFEDLERATHTVLETVCMPCPACGATGEVARKPSKKPPKRPRKAPLKPKKCVACAGTRIAPLRRRPTVGPRGGKKPGALQRRVLQAIVYEQLGNAMPLTDKGVELKGRGQLPPVGDPRRLQYLGSDSKVLSQYISQSGARQLAEVVEGCKPGASFLAAARRAGVEGLPAALVDAGKSAERPHQATGVIAYQTAQRLQKYRSTYLRHFLTDKVIRCRHDVQKATGRTSVSKWPYQQAPRSGGIRECIVPPPGYVFACYDLSQIELVCIAKLLDVSVQECVRRAQGVSARRQNALFRRLEHIGWRPNVPYESSLTRKLREGADCHLLVACHESLLNMPYAEAKAIKDSAKDKEEAGLPLNETEQRVIRVRQLAKVCNFGFPGGMSARTFVAFAAAQGITVDADLAKKLRTVWLDTWPEIELYFRLIGEITDVAPEVVIHDGIPVRRPCVYTLESGKPRGSVPYCAAANFGFQSLAALGAKDAMRMLLWQMYVGYVPEQPTVEQLRADPLCGVRLRAEAAATPRVLSALYGSRPCAFVHDEFLQVCPEGVGPAAGAELANTMVRGLTHRALRGYPVAATGHFGLERWCK